MNCVKRQGKDGIKRVNNLIGNRLHALRGFESEF